MNRITTCPCCATRINVPEETAWKTLICPHCLAEVENPRLGGPIRAPDLNTDVKRDLSAGSNALFVLIVLCVLGTVMAFFAPSLRRVTPAFWTCSLFALLVLVSIASIRGRGRGGSSDVRVPEVKNVLGCIFLVLGTIVAIVIFVFFACAIAMSNMQFGK